ncbi:M15 family metallopeptidase [Pseudoclavibacter sp. VKM Ac-2888]|uniref:M15 family metallopeptidase n=1 Tax=Pseudoclavibacter sp. VKM Ac-2888 TaxID=2783830 RepID=UPI001889C9C7|nr:M15 family metallopeptidase [Pseudoclavibacter sp. VKM Ac-2888]MBF4549219.1 M15 family metallopeptidase [Pseudoclavibacter sp. VKM Ac-2888]
MAFAKNIGFPNGDSRNADGEALGVLLRAEAAGALDAFAFYFEKEFGYRPDAAEGMRNLDRQNFYYDRFVNKRPGWTVAAVPGTSNHGWGLAVDFGGNLNVSFTEEHAWAAKTAPLFGWVWTGKDFGEPWHFDYLGVNVSAKQATEYIARGKLGGMIQDDGFTDQDRATLYALTTGARPLANGYPFPARDAVQNNLEAVITLLRQVATRPGVNLAEVSASLSNALTPLLPRAVADELARRLTKGT